MAGHLNAKQGEQIGRIFAYRDIFYIGLFWNVQK
jgi:hypothetical protein